MTPEERKAYQEYLADFDPSPIGNGEDYIYPLSEDGWLEKQEQELFQKIANKQLAECLLYVLAKYGAEDAVSFMEVMRPNEDLNLLLQNAAA
tara:strand:+ start:290 stop:565 length:276 start_codon:yes stop_codon:yes gene_type:complete